MHTYESPALTFKAYPAVADYEPALPVHHDTFEPTAYEPPVEAAYEPYVAEVYQPSVAYEPSAAIAAPYEPYHEVSAAYEPSVLAPYEAQPSVVAAYEAHEPEVYSAPAALVHEELPTVEVNTYPRSVEAKVKRFFFSISRRIRGSKIYGSSFVICFIKYNFFKVLLTAKLSS